MKAAILKILEAHRGGLGRESLRLRAIETLEGDASSAEINKLFASSLATLQKKEQINVDDEVIRLPGQLVAAEEEKKEKKEKKDTKDKKEKKDKHDKHDKHDNKKRKRDDGSTEVPEDTTPCGYDKGKYCELWRTGEQMWRDDSFDEEYLRTNPNNITRLFCGNLNKQISEEDLMACIEGITYIKWITDKQTGEFYGSTFVEMKDPKAAIDAIAKDKQKFMGRPLKIYYCPPRPGDVWPPRRGPQYDRSAADESASNNQNTKRGPPRRERTSKPPGCTKLYMGNLSYNIDDDTICEFFKDCGEIIGLRWLIREGTNEFRGGGYIQFATTEQCDAAIQKDGLELLGRPIKLDYTT